MPCGALLLALGLAPALAPAQAPGAAGPRIYSCVDAQGRRLTSDRPIAECSNREQRVLNRDGSTREVMAPQLTAAQKAAQDAREREQAELRSAQNDAARRDRNLVARYPDQAAHDKARAAALDSVRAAAKVTELRLADLAAERRPLLNDLEFYKGKPTPPQLKAKLEANDAATAAQQSAAQSQQAELVRVNQLYDKELQRLKALWAGAAPGSTPGSAPAARP